MTPRVFIVDDEAPARNRLKTLLADIAGDCAHILVGEAETAQGALEQIRNLLPDIVLLDIQMPATGGLELAAQLAEVVSPPPKVIFVTAFDSFALKAFDVQAIDYLVKPVRAKRLAQAMGRAAALLPDRPPNSLANLARQHFAVQERGRLLLVPVSEVLYLKAELKYVTVRTRDQEFLVEESLTHLEQELAATFIRVHRNALVAREAILGVERGSLAIDGDTERMHESWQLLLRDVEERLPISRRQWPVVKALLR